MKTRRTLLTAVFSAVLTLAGGTAHAPAATPPACLPGLDVAFQAHAAQ
jgi:hypothetical protein